uniref:Putative ovule protein n=1 Tax=Solanum chacoense TaxID=4108 RepID=A0A0V0GNN2_SOLCH
MHKVQLAQGEIAQNQTSKSSPFTQTTFTVQIQYDEKIQMGWAFGSVFQFSVNEITLNVVEQIYLLFNFCQHTFHTYMC